MIRLTRKEVEDENDDEDEDDWGSRGRELRPTIANIVRIKAIDQSGQHCYNTPEHFLKTVLFLVTKKNGEAVAGRSYGGDVHFDNGLTHTASLYSPSRQDPNYCPHRWRPNDCFRGCCLSNRMYHRIYD